MTPIGRFSLKTETETNPSVPTVFIALSSPPEDKKIDKESSPGENIFNNYNDDVMTVSEFISTWHKRNMPSLHPRYHFTVSSSKDGHFDSSTDSTLENNKNEEPTTTTKKVDLSDHVSETLHMQVYREDLKKRVEELVSSAMDVQDKLWSVQISSGDLGSSGAISKHKVEQIKKERMPEATSRSRSNRPLKETVLLFKCHHAMADGVSLAASISDLLDEAGEIRQKIEMEIKKRRKKSKELKWWQKLLKVVQKLIWFLLGSVHAMLHHMYLLLTTRKNPFLIALDEDSADSLTCGRSISWCDIASVEEVRMVAKKLGGKNTTVNDVFVSCISAAISRQLAQHKAKSQIMNAAAGTDYKKQGIKTMNVVIPAHLAGGIIPPGKGMGNLIGAFVARVPCEMKDDSTSSDRLVNVHNSLDKCKRSPAPILSYLMAKFVAQYIPERMAVNFFRHSGANAAVAISNTRGPDQKVHINGKPVESTGGFLPLPPNIPVGVLVSSYGSMVSLSINAERWAVPDADQFMTWILEEYKALCIEASKK